MVLTREGATQRSTVPHILVRTVACDKALLSACREGLASSDPRVRDLALQLALRRLALEAK